MSRRPRPYLQAVRQAVERHGGGLRGLHSALTRALRVAIALGPSATVARLRQSAARASPTAIATTTAHVFPPPAPLSALDQRIGVMAHLFYPDLIEEFAQALGRMPTAYTLLVSVVDEPARRQAERRFSRLPNLSALDVRVVANRGRDIAPFLVDFRDQLLTLDLVCHIHTKKSLYTGGEQNAWRRYLLNALLGAQDRIGWILGMFQAEPKLGLVYPDSYHALPAWGHTWLGNLGPARMLGARLGLEIDPHAYLDFPAGAMFWARVAALRPLLELQLRTRDFPPETGQSDGTVQHAIERLLTQVAQAQGYLSGILPADGRLALSCEGERNWTAALQMPVAERLRLSAIDARLLSVDLFDTLTLRPFLTPAGARQHLAHLARHRLGVDNFLTLRERAETRARRRYGRDPTLDEIHQALSTLSEAAGLDTAALQALELEHERTMSRPRQSVIDALHALPKRRLIAISDMYLSTPQLQAVLPAAVTALPAAWHVSCERGRRKDADATWDAIAAEEGAAPEHWLHIGDNEHADIQVPQRRGLLPPVHILRPAALLELAPALRPLRPPTGSRAPWPEQLWRGLLANRFAMLADRDPTRLVPRPALSAEDAGYGILGPLVLDYLIWLARTAFAHDVRRLLFLSREGFLLERAFARLRAADPALHALDGRYLLASRRATGLPALRHPQDLAHLLHASYTGTLAGLLSARLGNAAAQVCREHLGQARLRREIYLPEMATELTAWLRPALPELLALAASERDAYQQYWRAQVGDAPAMVADLGYAGTIQANLARLTGARLGGGYFALLPAARQLDACGWAQARHHDGRHATDARSPILQHDLLLEALLSAPHGQFLRFRRDADGSRLEPEFAASELTPAGRANLADLHAGTLAFIEDICAITGDDLLALELAPAPILSPLHSLATGEWTTAGDWLQTLAVEDAFTGRGRIAATTSPRPTAAQTTAGR